ncbi:putative ABC transporter solute-binding protein YclQ [Paenibacillus polymyxa E681]|uniref:siderophore ABC transporter substrate-binding protein n=1 Tax=Paenibacillus polymyxa TaxID=1406 RepID=UPI0001E31D91|nr:siderophore ABC transporter substrate-binding protein [Paenibacillus polymyxa]ADM71881.1 iron ABC transporter substrate-binding protein [Paenibacillus polymyxa E681]QNV58906.1 putative ABC transporter solute-binding protein YclQ [Paenibacillus polymyxa E681]QNV63741.1 putative ABC transporter solute-binding protein YclQ [Paenibacillus polymyxa E681]
MKKNMMFLTLMLALVLIVSACGKAAPATQETTGNGSSAATTESKTISVKHALDENPIQVKVNPKNVVVFDFGSLDTLDKLGVDVAAVAQQDLPTYLSKYKDSKYASAGTLFEPDYEKISDLSPELIIIGGRQADAYKELSKIAPTISMAVDTKDYIHSFKKNVETLGQIFDKEDAAKQELAAIDSSIKAVHDKAVASKAKGLIVLTNEGSLSAYGSQSRFGIIHDAFGVTPVDPDIKVSTHGQKVSFEYVQQKNPDYIFVVDRGAVVVEEGKEQVTGKQTMENELVKKTNAFKNGHIVYLDPNYWYLSGNGLESVSEMIKEMDAAL